jgi:hypothetical protein
MVRINAATGALAAIGDKEDIWEAYIPGTEPQEGEVRPVLDGSVTGAASEGAAGAMTPAVVSPDNPDQPAIVIGGPETGKPTVPEQENVRVIEGSHAPEVISSPEGSTSPAQEPQPAPAFKVDHPASNNSSPSTMGTGGLY